MLRLCSNSRYSVISLSLVNMPKYAVACGKIPGVYDTWEECQQQIVGFSRPVFKKFGTQEEAEAFIEEKRDQKSSVSRFGSVQPVQHESVLEDRILASDASLHTVVSKVNALENTLHQFMGDVVAKLNSLSNRLLAVEGKRSSSSANLDQEPYSKKPKEDYNFTRDQDGHVEVYTDGACSKNGRTGAQAGIGVWFGDEHPLNLSLPVRGPPTNNNAEIQAARLAVVQAANAGVTKLTVFTDSEFMITCITQWIHKWKRNDWKLSSGGIVKNKDELIKLDEALQRVPVVRWVHVRGHAGIKGNEKADQLAREGAKRYDPSITYSNLI